MYVFGLWEALGQKPHKHRNKVQSQYNLQSFS